MIKRKYKIDLTWNHSWTWVRWMCHTCGTSYCSLDSACTVYIFCQPWAVTWSRKNGLYVWGKFWDFAVKGSTTLGMRLSVVVTFTQHSPGVCVFAERCLLSCEWQWSTCAASPSVPSFCVPCVSKPSLLSLAWHLLYLLRASRSLWNHHVTCRPAIRVNVECAAERCVVQSGKCYWKADGCISIFSSTSLCVCACGCVCVCACV